MNTLYFFAGFFTSAFVIYLYAKYAAAHIVKDEHMNVHGDLMNEWRLSREIGERKAEALEEIGSQLREIKDALLTAIPDSASKQPQGVEIR